MHCPRSKQPKTQRLKTQKVPLKEQKAQKKLKKRKKDRKVSKKGPEPLFYHVGRREFHRNFTST